jgi:hypothetical protein
MEEFLRASAVIDWKHPEIIELASSVRSTSRILGL